MAARSWVDDGCGAAVLARTVREPRWNHQQSEIVGYSRRFSWFPDCASRDARAGARGQGCARICARNPRTSEPFSLSYVNHRVSGSLAVLERFSPEPGGAEWHADGGFLRFSHCLAGGKGCDRRCLVELPRPSGLARGGGGESFGDFALGDRPGRKAGTRGDGGCASSAPDRPDRAWRVAPGRSGSGGPCCGGRLGRENGGFLRFRAPLSDDVGRAMLEAMPQRRGNPPFPDTRPLPDRLGRSCVASSPWSRPRRSRQGGDRSRRGTPMSPIAGSAPLHHAGARDWRNLLSRSGHDLSRKGWNAAETTQPGGAKDGSGLGRWPRTPKPITGRGGGIDRVAGRLRRWPEATAEARHVKRG